MTTFAVLVIIASFVLEFTQERYLLVEFEDPHYNDYNEGLQSRASKETWKSCPRETSKPNECFPLANEVLEEQSCSDITGEEVSARLKGRIAYGFRQAVRACKYACGGPCKSFNIKKHELGRGYTCVFYSSVLDGQNCHGKSGLEGAAFTISESV